MSIKGGKMKRSYVRPELYIKNEKTGQCVFTSREFVRHSEQKIHGLSSEGHIKGKLLDVRRKKKQEIPIG